MQTLSTLRRIYTAVGLTGRLEPREEKQTYRQRHRATREERLELRQKLRSAIDNGQRAVAAFGK